MTFGTYDFETMNWVEPVCGDLYHGPDGSGHSHEYASLHQEGFDDSEAVVRSLLMGMAASDVKTFWAHNGGKFDALMIVDVLKDMPGWKCDGAVAAGRIVSLRIMSPHRTWELKDSYAVIQSSLDKALTSFGIPHKKVFTKDDYAALDKDPLYMFKLARDNPAKLKAGCQADTEALWHLVAKAESLFEEWGGKLKSTFSASALSVVKAQVGKPLPSHEGNQWANDIGRKAFAGGRVEVFKHSPGGALQEYDVTSSYPWSMTQALPWHLEGFGEPCLYDASRVSLVYAKVKVPQQHVPPLPYVPPSGGLFFPWGEWSGWFNGNELAYAIEKCGVTAKFMDAVNYTVDKPFESFVKQVFALKSTSAGAVREFCKLVLNGCYGKFGQKPETSKLKVFASMTEALEWARKAQAKEPTPLNSSNTAWSVKEYRWPKHTHYALAGFVTAYSRILLHKHLVRSVGLAYCDTDSVHCKPNAEMRKHADAYGKELGELMHKRDIERARYYAPKLYELDLAGADSHYASKGFPVSKEAFSRIIAGELVGNPKGRMQLIKTQLRKGEGVKHLSEADTAKAWSGRSNKRMVDKSSTDGSTHAWHVRDLHEGHHLEQKSPIAPADPE